MLICVGWVGCSDLWNGSDAQTCGVSGMLRRVECVLEQLGETAGSKGTTAENPLLLGTRSDRLSLHALILDLDK